ncbi:Slc9a8 [Symbiodinium natans]|uniref:Slc9a8 protein n=1 Tax=Symbiodinium natans TaxID=878477 RepID=A0A812TVY0_9DINO|nr:Slc9a8 [Symbiodinium natans]
MAAHPENIEEWCYLVPHLLSQAGWQSIAEGQAVSFSHCKCPWGGSLVKLAVLRVKVTDPPEDPAHILVRPESRAWGASKFSETSPEYFAVQKQFAPGDAVVHRWASFKILRIFAVLLGDIGTELVQNHFYDPASAVELRVRTRRNYPQTGDCAQTLTSLSEPFEAVNFCRPHSEPGWCDVYHIFRVPLGLNLSKWAAAQFHEAMESGSKVVQYYLNRPGIHQIRQLDQEFYVVLSMQSFKRGYPLLPVHSGQGDHVTRIDAGQSMGLTNWVRYDPALVGSHGFYLSEYLQLFTERIGEHDVSFYQTLDGQELLYFQCVVAREDWARIEDRMRDAYLLQKTAYRRANGGAQAPGLGEAGAARFCHEVDFTSLEARLSADAAPQQKVQVRNTFVEVEREAHDEVYVDLRRERRCRTVMPASAPSSIAVA